MPYPPNNRYKKPGSPKPPVPPGRYSALQAGVLIGLVIAIGGYFILHSSAAKPMVASLQAEQMILPTGSSVVNDDSASGGREVKTTATSSLIGSVNLPRDANSVAVVAKATSCGGTPYFNLVADGKTLIGSATVGSSSLHSYTFTANLGSGSHNIKLSANNLG